MKKEQTTNNEWRTAKKKVGWVQFNIFGPKPFIIAVKNYIRLFKRQNYHLWFEDEESED